MRLFTFLEIRRYAQHVHLFVWNQALNDPYLISPQRTIRIYTYNCFFARILSAGKKRFSLF
jgi:hypothetical protein